MRALRSRQRIVPTVFYLAGVSILNWHWLAFGNSLPARVNSLDPISRAIFGFIVLSASITAFTTGWGLRHQRKWTRWMGVFPCALLALLGFPSLSVAGAIGIVLLWTHPVGETGFLTAKEFWSPQRSSGWQIAGSILCWTLLFRLFYSKVFASAGQHVQSEWVHFYIPLLLVAIPLNIFIHESGHALASHLVGFRLRVFAVGPFVLVRNGNSFQLRFSMQTRSLASGFIYSLPVNQHRVREKDAIVVAAGPLANLLTGAALSGILGLPALSASPALWTFAAEGCVTAFGIAVASLLPLGYSDGTMLLHLLMNTARGKELLNSKLRAAGLLGGRDNLSERRETLRQLLESRAPDPVKLGVQYVLLGQAEVNEHHIRDAESHLVTGLAKIPEDLEPAIRLLGWQSLHTLRCIRYDRPGAGEAYRRALGVALQIREKFNNPLARIGVSASIASLHSRAHAWRETLDETAAGLLFYAGQGGGEDVGWQASYGRLLRLRAHALLQTGSVDGGIQTAEEAASAIRTQPAGTSGPWELAVLADTLWDAGQDERAISLLSEAVTLLEERGASRLAARFGLLLAKFLAQTGRVSDAACALPPEPEDAELRRKYLDARAIVRRMAGDLSTAAADLSAALACCQGAESADETQLAVTRAKLASVLAEAGDLDRAESFAADALEKLSAIDHPDLADACITLAVVAGRRGGSPSDYVERAIHCWRFNEWRFPAVKAREAEAGAKLLDSGGLTDLAAQCRAVIPHLAEQCAMATSAA